MTENKHFSYEKISTYISNEKNIIFYSKKVVFVNNQSNVQWYFRFNQKFASFWKIKQGLVLEGVINKNNFKINLLGTFFFIVNLTNILNSHLSYWISQYHKFI
jgi:hypothetical protein